MRYFTKSILLVLVLVQWSGNNSIFGKNETEARKIFELKSLGWKVVGKKSKIKKLPGIKPYENLKRIVQVVKYKLSKDNKVLFCTVEYDSQLDKIMDECISTIKY